jgi:hypothetical protein
MNRGLRRELKMLVRRPERKRSLGRHRHGREDDIKAGLK